MQIDSLEKIYSELPKLQCLGKCQSGCGPIPMAPAEEAVFRSHQKLIPNPELMLKSGQLDCPHLGLLGQCNVYDIRPLICRIYGLVKKMACQYGCKPEYWLTDEQAYSLINRAKALK